MWLIPISLLFFNTVGEIFFPIDFLASRIAGGRFMLKKASDDSVVWNNKQFNDLIDRPNCLNSFQGIVYQHFVYKYATGNSYLKMRCTWSISNIKDPNLQKMQKLLGASIR